MPRPVSTLSGALWQEFETIHGAAATPSTGAGPDAALSDYYKTALDAQQTALCLSGGGIRSAAFSLGVIQGLAQRKLLTSFHYLSVVSGGGYIGGWLTAMLHEHKGDAATVQDLLGGKVAPPELQQLRQYTNFLTPSPGVSSPDTWAGILLWVRNSLVNWLVFLPALFALAMLPGIYADAMDSIGPWSNWPLLLIGLACLFIGIHNGAAHLPSHAFAAAVGRGRHSTFVAKWVVWPLLAWAVLVPLVAAPWLHPVMPLDALLGDVIPPLGFLVMEAAYIVAGLHQSKEHRKMFLDNFLWWTIASLVAAAVLWLLLDFSIALPVVYLAVLGPLGVTLAHLLQSLVFVALRKESFRGDLDREWLARLNAEKVVPALLWAVFAAVCLLLPMLVLDQWSSRFMPFVVSIPGLLAGPAAAYLGKISKVVTGSQGKDDGPSLPFNILLALVAAVFAATLFMLLARLAAYLTGGNRIADIVLPAVALLLAWAFGERINVNRFSMHAVYRNRLIRGFLGSARAKRTPDDFTGMDPADNPRMSELATEAGEKRLFPVVNVTLNLSAGRNNAWAERKGESFTITLCACGAAYLQTKEDACARNPVRGAYVRTEAYAGDERETGPHDKGRGITLGTALALSGAAASPNMGYHTSPGAAFLMTLFNVRLGAWLPNPATASTPDLQRPKPPNAVLTLARELLGRSDDRSNAVYLSDGGHFEDLGVYEMVRRRCRRILVVDAGEDPDSKFEDLGNAVRKVRIDLDINIEFDPPVAIGSRRQPRDPFRCVAYGRIHYREIDEPGEIIYLKPADLPVMPMDVRAYWNLNDAFPHQSTGDQFFSESQFESYRELGLIELLSLAQNPGSLAAFFAAVKQYVSEQKKPT